MTVIKHFNKYDATENQVTLAETFYSRRALLKGALATGLTASIGQSVAKEDELVTPKELAFSYNNFYEFGFDKEDPAKYADQLVTDPWAVEVSGACEQPGKFDLADMIAKAQTVERIYRLRCVEAWSMVVPWQGVQLADVIKALKPTSDAKYVSFETLYRPDQMPGQRTGSLDWPYREGLRIDEATHPLTLLATGAYGQDLPNQMGAPIRLVVPWKYGFKSIKSIVKIHFTENMPETTWNQSAPNEYGFFANVNPEVDHPRWSQATERRIDGSATGFSALFQSRIPTLPFNGYTEVAELYRGMDLRKNY
ncbi:MAG: protein-methionine-sulfoxide reductase catalytic subunit MsrP [Gammaproteobacteria bacterium]|nr:protein-methionine-sulfoxide reductase catalytic subunit MsrP [Gammaproteobacteria bacterium]